MSRERNTYKKVQIFGSMLTQQAAQSFSLIRSGALRTLSPTVNSQLITKISTEIALLMQDTLQMLHIVAEATL